MPQHRNKVQSDRQSHGVGQLSQNLERMEVLRYRWVVLQLESALRGKCSGWTVLPPIPARVRTPCVRPGFLLDFSACYGPKTNFGFRLRPRLSFFSEVLLGLNTVTTKKPCFSSLSCSAAAVLECGLSRFCLMGFTDREVGGGGGVLN